MSIQVSMRLRRKVRLLVRVMKSVPECSGLCFDILLRYFGVDDNCLKVKTYEKNISFDCAHRRVPFVNFCASAAGTYFSKTATETDRHGRAGKRCLSLLQK